MIDAVGIVILIVAICAPDVFLIPVVFFWSAVGSILDFVLNLVFGPKDKEGGKD